MHRSVFASLLLLGWLYFMAYTVDNKVTKYELDKASEVCKANNGLKYLMIPVSTMDKRKAYCVDGAEFYQKRESD